MIWPDSYTFLFAYTHIKMDGHVHNQLDNILKEKISYSYQQENFKKPQKKSNKAYKFLGK